jgi:hypothetical protein
MTSDGLKKFRALVDSLRERRRAGEAEESLRGLLGKIADLIEELDDEDFVTVGNEAWRGWPDQYDARMGGLVENVNPDDPGMFGNPPRGQA